MHGGFRTARSDLGTQADRTVYPHRNESTWISDGKWDLPDPDVIDLPLVIEDENDFFAWRVQVVFNLIELDYYTFEEAVRVVTSDWENTTRALFLDRRHPLDASAQLARLDRI